LFAPCLTPTPPHKNRHDFKPLASRALPALPRNCWVLRKSIRRLFCGWASRSPDPRGVVRMCKFFHPRTGYLPRAVPNPLLAMSSSLSSCATLFFIFFAPIRLGEERVGFSRYFFSADLSSSLPPRFAVRFLDSGEFSACTSVYP